MLLFSNLVAFFLIMLAWASEIVGLLIGDEAMVESVLSTKYFRVRLAEMIRRGKQRWLSPCFASMQWTLQ